MRTTFEGPVATGFLVGEASMHNRESGLRDDALITSVTFFAISCINAFASIFVRCKMSFISFPSGQIYFYDEIARNI